jgi:hypothetical protein
VDHLGRPRARGRRAPLRQGLERSAPRGRHVVAIFRRAGRSRPARLSTRPPVAFGSSGSVRRRWLRRVEELCDLRLACRHRAEVLCLRCRAWPVRAEEREDARQRQTGSEPAPLRQHKGAAASPTQRSGRARSSAEFQLRTMTSNPPGRGRSQGSRRTGGSSTVFDAPRRPPACCAGTCPASQAACRIGTGADRVNHIDGTRGPARDERSELALDGDRRPGASRRGIVGLSHDSSVFFRSGRERPASPSARPKGTPRRECQ